jgi:hypothetical protein
MSRNKIKKHKEVGSVSGWVVKVIVNSQIKIVEILKIILGAVPFFYFFGRKYYLFTSSIQLA